MQHNVAQRNLRKCDHAEKCRGSPGEVGCEARRRPTRPLEDLSPCRVIRDFFKRRGLPGRFRSGPARRMPKKGRNQFTREMYSSLQQPAGPRTVLAQSRPLKNRHQLYVLSAVGWGSAGPKCAKLVCLSCTGIRNYLICSQILNIATAQCNVAKEPEISPICYYSWDFTPHSRNQNAMSCTGDTGTKSYSLWSTTHHPSSQNLQHTPFQWPLASVFAAWQHRSHLGI